MYGIYIYMAYQQLPGLHIQIWDGSKAISWFARAPRFLSVVITWATVDSASLLEGNKTTDGEEPWVSTVFRLKPIQA